MTTSNADEDVVKQTSDIASRDVKWYSSHSGGQFGSFLKH